MKPKLTGLICMVLLVVFQGYSQRTVDLRLVEMGSYQKEACFNIELRSPYGHDINLAGQNYRIFFDAKKLSFQESKTVSKLSEAAYTPMDILHSVHGDIGFLSLSIDGRELNNEVLVLDRNASWETISSLCFDKVSDRTFELTWAHPDRTGSFASASVALSEWVSENRQQILDFNEIIDYSNKDLSQVVHSDNINIRLFPNPVVDFVSIELNGTDEENQLIIKDVIGREVVFDQINGRQHMAYDLTNWPDGIYTLELLNGAGKLIYTDQLMKARF